MLLPWEPVIGPSRRSDGLAIRARVRLHSHMSRTRILSKCYRADFHPLPYPSPTFQGISTLLGSANDPALSACPFLSSG